MKKNAPIIFAIVLLALLIAGAIALFALPSPEPPPDTTLSGLMGDLSTNPWSGLMGNPNVLDAVTSAPTSTPSATPPVPLKPAVGKKDVLSYLGRLELESLSRLLDNESFETSDYTDDVRVDLVNTLNADATTAPMFLYTYRTPEVLAAAIAVMPMEYKLESFISADSLIFPAETEPTNLVEYDVAETEKQQVLGLLNRDLVSFQKYTDTAAFDMTVYGVPCRLWVVENSNGWRPYLLESTADFETGILTQLEARRLKESLYGTGITLDDVVAVERA